MLSPKNIATVLFILKRIHFDLFENKSLACCAMFCFLFSVVLVNLLRLLGSVALVSFNFH